MVDRKATEAVPPQVAYLPVGIFGSVTGLTGLAVAWRLAHARYGLPEWPAHAVAFAAVADLMVLLLAYGAKAWAAPGRVRAEFEHPVVGNLFGLVLISLLVVPGVLAPIDRLVARAIWSAGAVGMVAFAWIMTDRWMTSRQEVEQASPAWFIPTVGLLNVPLAVPSLGLSNVEELSWFTLSVGLFFTLPLFTIVFSRLLFEQPLPDPLKPSLLIVVAPFSIGYSSYTITSGSNDAFGKVLYMLMLFFLAVLLGQLRHLPRCCPFKVSWWAVSFPLASSAIAAVRYATLNPGILADAVAFGLLAVATAVILWLAGRTAYGLATSELRALAT
ncbi:MAG: SLAC1 anion channel family protein [Parafilimonas terrae]|nr:SLAC1 anion channel family protein [Parafilimonas terrae]